MEFKNCVTQETLIKTPSITYSNSRMILADFTAAEELMREGISQLCRSHLIKVLIQPFDHHIKKFSPVEIRSFLDSTEHAGAKTIIIDTTQIKLSSEEVIKRLKQV